MTRFLFTLLSLSVISGEDLRFTAIEKQGFDTSCGVAVTASLLATYWNIPVAESDLYQDMILDRLDGTGANYTISFATMLDYLPRRGVAGKAYRMDWDALADSLAKGYAPVVINYDKPKPHFALLLAVNAGDTGAFAVVADPARGTGLVSRAVFEAEYSGNALLTASREAERNAEFIAGEVTAEERRLAALERLAAHRR